MRKIIAIAALAATLAAPTLAQAAAGPKSLSFCDIATFLGFTFVKECE